MSAECGRVFEAHHKTCASIRKCKTFEQKATLRGLRPQPNHEKNLNHETHQTPEKKQSRRAWVRQPPYPSVQPFFLGFRSNRVPGKNGCHSLIKFDRLRPFLVNNGLLAIVFPVFGSVRVRSSSTQFDQVRQTPQLCEWSPDPAQPTKGLL